jgi:hypothetical protein
MAEDVHEQGIRAVAGVQFTSGGVVAEQMLAGGGMRFGQASSPSRIDQDPPVGGGIEIAMPTILVRSIEDRRNRTHRMLMQKTVLGSPPDVPGTQLLSQPKGAAPGRLHSVGHSRFLTGLVL